MVVTIETDRLVIRPVVPDDAEAIFKWASDPEVTKYMIYTTHPNAEYTREWLESRMGGLVYKKEEDIWVIGYNLRKDYWGKGIVPEAMRGIIEHVAMKRPIRVIRGGFAVENDKSRKVMEKLGMHFLRDSEYSKLDGSAHFQSKIYVKEEAEGECE